jgi:hypothetical protein
VGSVAFKSADTIPWTDRGKHIGPNEFDEKFLRECLVFATRVRDHAADFDFSLPNPFGRGLRHEPNAEERHKIEAELELAVSVEFGIPDPTNEFPKGEEYQ